MPTVSNEILKACDIRGIYPRPLGAPQAELIGSAVGTLMREEAHRNIKVVVGHDIRHSSEGLSKALLHGLRISGLKIVDAGLCSTPLLAFATRFSGASVGIMVTASHNPPEYNGVKFFLQGLPVETAWMDRLYAILQAQSFRKGAGVLEKKDFYPDYRNTLVNSIAQNFQDFKIVVDAGNGSAALTAPGILKAFHCEFEMMHGQPNGDYPGRGADSSEPAALEALGEKVKKTGAHLGVAFDGDADRASFVDEKGREVPNDVILCLFAEQFLKKFKNPKVVFDGKCSGWIEKAIQKEGGTALLERSGHTFIFERVQKEKAVLAGEASGHFFLPGDFPGDALYACLRLIEILKGKHQSLSALAKAFPSRVSTHDVKFDLPQEQMDSLCESLKTRAEALGASVSTLDGVRAVFEEGWGIVRRSVTEPVVAIRLEAPSTPKLAALAGNWFMEFPEIQQRILKKIRGQ